jgi:type I restriction enzyme R subunit
MIAVDSPTPTTTSDPQRIKMVMTRGKDDEKAFYDLLGNKDERKKFDTQFKKAVTNFKIAIVVGIEV